MAIHCENCRRPLMEGEGVWGNLRSLVAAVEVLRAEESITPATAELMLDWLSWLNGPVNKYDEHAEAIAESSEQAEEARE